MGPVTLTLGQVFFFFLCVSFCNKLFVCFLCITRGQDRRSFIRSLRRMSTFILAASRDKNVSNVRPPVLPILCLYTYCSSSLCLRSFLFCLFPLFLLPTHLSNAFNSFPRVSFPILIVGSNVILHGSGTRSTIIKFLVTSYKKRMLDHFFGWTSTVVNVRSQIFHEVM